MLICATEYLSLLSEVAGDKRYACDLHHVQLSHTSLLRNLVYIYIYKQIGKHNFTSSYLPFVLYSKNYIILITVPCSSRIYMFLVSFRIEFTVCRYYFFFSPSQFPFTLDD